MKLEIFRFPLKTLPALFFAAAAIVALAMFAAPRSSSEKADVLLTAAPTQTDQSLSASVTDNALPGAEFVGYRHKGVPRGDKLPNGARDLGGGLLTDEDYGVSRFSKGKKFMLWLERIVERDDDGVPDWEVKDVLIFEKPKKNQKFLFSYSSTCVIGGAENLDLIVMVEDARKRKTYKILKAWLANVETERFEESSIDSIVCSYESE